MERHPLDAEMVEESYEEIIRAKNRLERRLAEKHDLPMLGFGRMLGLRVKTGEIDEDVEVMQWQSLNAALFDWIENEINTEPISLAQASSSEGPPEAAFFICFSALYGPRQKN